jgi:hypothetical protein
MIVPDGRHQDVAPAKVRFESSSGTQSRLAVNLASSDFGRESRLYFHHRETRNYALCADVAENPCDEIAA